MAVVERFRLREASDLSHLYTEETAGGPYTIHFDEWLTRRKRFHIITDRNGAVVFRSRWVRDLINWLDHQGEMKYLALGGQKPWLVTMRAPPKKKEPKA